MGEGTLAPDEVAILRAIVSAGPDSDEGKIAVAMLKAAGFAPTLVVGPEPPSLGRSFLEAAIDLLPGLSAAAGAATPLLVASGVVTGGVGTAIGAGAGLSAALGGIAAANKSSILDSATALGI